jgi:hypothetical protein
MPCLLYDAYVFSSTKLEIRGRGERGEEGRINDPNNVCTCE